MYEVGQVLYTILTEKQIVVPVKVIEQVTTKTLEGEETNYKLLLPNSKQQKVDFSRFDNVYADISEIESNLIDNAKKAIEKMLFDAITLEDNFFKEKEDKEIVDQSFETPTCNNDEVKVKIDLGDGIVANINKENIENHLAQENLQKKTWIKF